MITYYGFIGNGRVNKICAGAYFSSVVGGYCNTIASSHASIVGGYNNCVTGNNSAILGGSGNNDNSLPYVGIFGCNLNNPAVITSCTFHANILSACDTPIGAAGLPSGMIVKVTGAPPFGALPLIYYAIGIDFSNYMKSIWVIILLLIPFVLKAQIVTVIAGNGTTGNGTPAIHAHIYDPCGMVFDKKGNLYFATNLGNQVREIDTAGIITTIAGNGSGGFSGDSGLATSATLRQPVDLAIDTAGNIYLSDAANNRIRKITVSTGIITTVVGNGIGAFAGDNGPAINASIYSPNGVCFDKFGNMYIADYGNNRVRKVDNSGIIKTVAGSGIGGWFGDGGLATAAKCIPIDVRVDNIGNLFIDDWGSGTPTSGGTIRKVDTFGIIMTVAGDTTSGIYNGDGILATSATMNPQFISLDENGNLYLSDYTNNRIRTVDGSGIIHTIVGDGIAGNTGDGGQADSVEIYYPSGLAFDKCGNLYFGQVGIPRLRKVTFDTTTVPSITISATPSDSVCSGTSVTFTAAVSVTTSSYAYQWLVNGIPAGTDSIYTFIPANNDSIRCTLSVSGLCNMPGSNTVHMIVDTFIKPNINISSNPTAILGSTVTVNATVTNTGSSYNINWYDNSVLFNTTTVPAVTYIKVAGTDHITATLIPTSVGCYDSTTSSVITITDSSTGLNNIAMPQVYVYPNPAHSQITVISQNLTNITISDLLGQTLINKDCNTSQININIETLPLGVYVVKINNNEGQKTVAKIVKE